MRIDIRHPSSLSDFLQYRFNSILAQTFMGIFKPRKQRRVIILPAFQIHPQVYSHPGIDVSLSLFVSLSDNGNIPVLEGYILPIH